MLKFFRAIALFEGVTTLALFLVAMPLKYGLGYTALIRPIGMTHGVAFLLYLLAMILVLPGKGFGLVGWLRTTLASFVPFGTFLNDPYLKRMEARAAAVTARS